MSFAQIFISFESYPIQLCKIQEDGGYPWLRLRLKSIVKTMANSFYDEVEFNGFQNCKFISRANELGSIRILNLVICVDHFALL